ncbi:hypothetical protein WJ40_12560 [Burkholderia cepacia]|nr:hypothetical protein WJ40_12560 [Burkholderia cepacia]
MVTQKPALLCDGFFSEIAIKTYPLVAPFFIFQTTNFGSFRREASFDNDQVPSREYLTIFSLPPHYTIQIIIIVIFAAERKCHSDWRLNIR